LLMTENTKAKILLIERHDLVRELIEEELGHEGYKVIEPVPYPNGSPAIAYTIAKFGVPDLAIVNVVTSPSGDIWQRDSDTLSSLVDKGVPVIVTTADAKIAIKFDGILPHMQKPCRFSDYVVAVKNALGDKAATHERVVAGMEVLGIKGSRPSPSHPAATATSKTGSQISEYVV
jgi:hypothetical protein